MSRHEYAPPEPSRVDPGAPAPPSRPTIGRPVPTLPDMPARDGLIALLIALGFGLAVVATWDGYGHSWDEAYYYEPAVYAREWTSALWSGDFPEAVAEDSATSRSALARWASRAIDPWWGGPRVPDGDRINELPAGPKFAWAAGLAVFESILGPSNALRAPVAFAFVLLLLLVYRIAWALSGRLGGLAAVVLLATLPHVWALAHLAVAEIFAALTFLLTAWCYRRGLDSRAWMLLAGGAFGLALNTKIQAVLIPVMLIPWAYLIARSRRHGAIWLPMVLIGPLVAVAGWPWLWPNPLGRGIEFLKYYADHGQTAVYYLGQKWNLGPLPPCPWHYSWVITAVTWPPATLVAFLGGVGVALWRNRDAPLFCLIVIWALFPIAFNSLPSQLKYDGTRLFAWAFPAAAITAAVALEAATRWLMGDETSLARKGLGGLVYGGVLMASVLATASSHPHNLSYFNALVGGTPGAAERGFEVTYWGESLTPAVIEELNALLPPDAILMTRALHDRALLHQQAWGLLRQDIRLGGPEEAQFILLQNRRGFWGVADWADLDEYENRQPEKMTVWDHEGVPLLYLFDRR